MQPICKFLHLNIKDPLPPGHNNRPFLLLLLLPEQVIQEDRILHLLHLPLSSQPHLHLRGLQHQLADCRLLSGKGVVSGHYQFGSHSTGEYTGDDGGELVHRIEVFAFRIESYVVFPMDCDLRVHEDRYRPYCHYSRCAGDNQCVNVSGV